MFGIGFSELVLILIIGLIVLGPEKLPGLARALAKGLNEFKKAATDIKSSFDMSDLDREPPPVAGKDYSTTSQGQPADKNEPPAIKKETKLPEKDPGTRESSDG